MKPLVAPRTLALAGALALASPALGWAPEPAAAIVSASSGQASLRVGTEQPRALRPYEWLPAGARLLVPAGSRVTLAFADGSRFELTGAASASVGESGLAASSGTVRALPRVPPLPRVQPIAGETRSSRAGAVRIRGTRIAGLYPRGGVCLLAEQAALRFTPVAGASRYHVEIEDDSGKSVFAAETDADVVAVSSGVLKAGQRYYWRVKTLDRSGAAARGEAEFTTLSAENAALRLALRAWAAGADDAAALALLAGIDRGLLLLLEARDGFRRAVDAAPGDAALRQALEEVEQALAAGDELARP
jgi:hypothetical protein